ncbi:MAG: integration host factor subunit alpha, partial [Thiotrichales bacterium]|nr:integration host factor subunit alpha [Thiotrichales bacterium]MBT5984962.1 integration host factor subunit alpha [Thiotrichales bacterium]
MSLTKQDIANTLVKKTELTQTQALALTNQFFDQIIETLKSGEEIKLSSFGNFVVR